MKPVVLLLAIAASLAISGCAGGPDGTIAGTRMDLRDYSSVKIGMLPVAINPNYDSGSLQLRELQKSVAEAIEAATPLHIERVNEKAEVPFPLTPAQLATLGTKSGFDALIGASVIAWNPPTGGHRARASVMISFVDLHDPHRKWMVSGTWKAFSVGDLPTTIGSGLEPQLKDLTRWLKSGLIPLFASQASADDPIVTYYSPSSESGRTVGDKVFPLVVSGIDDDGLKSLSITNTATDFAWSPVKEVLSSNPIYISTSVQIPLAKGRNRIVISAVNTRGRRIDHTITQTSTSSRGTHLLAVGVENDDSELEADDADNAVRAIRRSATDVGLPGVHVLENRDATGEKLGETMHDMRGDLGPGDELVVILTGRGNLSHRQPYLQLAVEPGQTAAGDPKAQIALTENSSFHRLTLEDLETLTSGYPTLVVLDLCTDSPAVDYLRQELQASLGTLPQRPANRLTRIIADVSDCKDGVGRITKRLARNFDDATRPEDLSAESLFASLSNTRRLMQWRFRASPEPADLQILSWNGKDSGAKAQPPAAQQQQAAPLPTMFWAVVASTMDKNAAMTQAEGIKQAFPESAVVLGTNGVFNVALGSFATADDAWLALKKADGPAQSTASGSVLAPEKVKSTVTR